MIQTDILPIQRCLGYLSPNPGVRLTPVRRATQLTRLGAPPDTKLFLGLKDQPKYDKFKVPLVDL